MTEADGRKPRPRPATQRAGDQRLQTILQGSGHGGGDLEDRPHHGQKQQRPGYRVKGYHIEAVRQWRGVLDLAHRGLRRRIQLREAALQTCVLAQLYGLSRQRIYNHLSQLLDALPPAPINHHHRDGSSFSERGGIDRLAVVEGHIRLRQRDDEAVGLFC